MSRDLGDLSPREWEQAVNALQTSQVDDKTVLVRSHLWPQADGSYDWMLLVPGTLYRAEGNSPSIAAMDVQIVEWYPDAADPATRMTVARIVPEDPQS